MFKPFYFKKSEFTLQEIALHAIPRRLKWIDFVTERRWSYTVLDEDDRSVPVSKETWMCKAHNITSIEGSHRTVNCSSTFTVSSSAIASISYSVFGMVLLMLFLLCLCVHQVVVLVFYPFFHLFISSTHLPRLSLIHSHKLPTEVANKCKNAWTHIGQRSLTELVAFLLILFLKPLRISLGTELSEVPRHWLLSCSVLQQLHVLTGLVKIRLLLFIAPSGAKVYLISSHNPTCVFARPPWLLSPVQMSAFYDSWFHDQVEDISLPFLSPSLWTLEKKSLWFCFSVLLIGGIRCINTLECSKENLPLLQSLGCLPLTGAMSKQSLR